MKSTHRIYFEFPSKQQTSQFVKRKFKTLNQAINDIHKLVPTKAKFKLKSFGDNQSLNFVNSNLTLFQCGLKTCPSYILMRYVPRKASEIKGHFMIQRIHNKHCHKQSQQRLIYHPDQLFRIQQQQNLFYLNKFQAVKRMLRNESILMYFRDFISNYEHISRQKINDITIQTPQADCSLPYKLPYLAQKQNNDLTFRLGIKKLNQKKGTYIYIIQVSIFDKILTQLKFINCLRKQSPQKFLFIVLLMYLIFNKINLCRLQVQQIFWKEIQAQKNQEDTKFIKVIQEIRSIFFDFFMNQNNSFKLSQKNKVLQSINNIRDYENRKNTSFQDLGSLNGYLRSDLKELQYHQAQLNKTIINFHQLEANNIRNLTRRLSLGEQTYKQGTLGKRKDNDWLQCEQKPSFLRKMNIILNNQQKKRIKRQINLLSQKQKNGQRLGNQFKDNNFVIIDDSSAEQNKIQGQFQHQQNADKNIQNKIDCNKKNVKLSNIGWQKTYQQIQAQNYLKSQLKQVQGQQIYFDFDVQRQKQKMNQQPQLDQDYEQFQQIFDYFAVQFPQKKESAVVDQSKHLNLNQLLNRPSSRKQEEKNQSQQKDDKEQNNQDQYQQQKRSQHHDQVNDNNRINNQVDYGNRHEKQESQAQKVQIQKQPYIDKQAYQQGIKYEKTSSQKQQESKQKIKKHQFKQNTEIKSIMASQVQIERKQKIQRYTQILMQQLKHHQQNGSQQQADQSSSDHMQKMDLQNEDKSFEQNDQKQQIK